jgi:hypothetical protein
MGLRKGTESWKMDKLIATEVFQGLWIQLQLFEAMLVENRNTGHLTK